MYEIFVERHFDAAHALRGYKGKCEALHGHRFGVVAKVKAKQLDDIGLAYDFAELKRNLDEILASFDHTYLNDVSPFNQINPSSENIAAAIYEELNRKLANEPVSLSSVEVWESPVTGIAYSPD